MKIQEIDAKTLSLKFSKNENFILLDVRTNNEVLLSSIKGAIHISMNDIPDRITELDMNKEIIVHCKSGKRSAKVCKFLLHNNFSNVKNLKGGIIAWAQEIDPAIIVF